MRRGEDGENLPRRRPRRRRPRRRETARAPSRSPPPRRARAEARTRTRAPSRRPCGRPSLGRRRRGPPSSSTHPSKHPSNRHERSRRCLRATPADPPGSRPVLALANVVAGALGAAADASGRYDPGPTPGPVAPSPGSSLNRREDAPSPVSNGSAPGGFRRTSAGSRRAPVCSRLGDARAAARAGRPPRHLHGQKRPRRRTRPRRPLGSLERLAREPRGALVVLARRGVVVRGAERPPPATRSRIRSAARRRASAARRGATGPRRARRSSRGSPCGGNPTPPQPYTCRRCGPGTSRRGPGNRSPRDRPEGLFLAPRLSPRRPFARAPPPPAAFACSRNPRTGPGTRRAAGRRRRGRARARARPRARASRRRGSTEPIRRTDSDPPRAPSAPSANQTPTPRHGARPNAPTTRTGRTPSRTRP